MKINRVQLRRMILKEARYLFEGDGEPELQIPGEAGEVIANIYKVIHFDDDTNKGPRMLGIGGYEIEEFEPAPYDDVDGICFIKGMNNQREAEHVIQILQNSGRLDKYDLYYEAQPNQVLVAFNY